MCVARLRSGPNKAIRAIALAMFNAIDIHPWVGTQISCEPWESAMMQIFESVAKQIQALVLRQIDAARLPPAESPAVAMWPGSKPWLRSHCHVDIYLIGLYTID